MGVKVLCVILARGGSKGLIDKNLKELDGIPLVARPVIDAKKSKYINSIVVSTDSNEIAKVAKEFGADVPFIRPDELSDDFATTESALQHAIIEYEKQKKIKFDISVFLTATDVFRDPNIIDRGIKILIENPDLDSVFSGSQTHKNFWEKDSNGNWVRIRDWMKVYSSRQVRKSIVREDTGIFSASRSHLWRQGKRIGDKVEIILNNDPYSSTDIHTIDDLKLAQMIIDLKKSNA